MLAMSMSIATVESIAIHILQLSMLATTTSISAMLSSNCAHCIYIAMTMTITMGRLRI